MIAKTFRVFFLVILCCSLCNKQAVCQTIELNVIGSCGQHYINEDVQWSYTVGESIIVTVDNSNAVLTQGFHQSGVDIISECDDYMLEVLKIYPNPASNILHIESAAHLPYFIYDNMGRKVLNGLLVERGNIINISGLSNGVYILKVSVACKIKTIKVVVNNENN